MLLHRTLNGRLKCTDESRQSQRNNKCSVSTQQQTQHRYGNHSSSIISQHDEAHDEHMKLPNTKQLRFHGVHCTVRTLPAH